MKLLIIIIVAVVTFLGNHIDNWGGLQLVLIIIKYTDNIINISIWGSIR